MSHALISHRLMNRDNLDGPQTAKGCEVEAGKIWNRREVAEGAMLAATEFLLAHGYSFHKRMEEEIEDAIVCALYVTCQDCDGEECECECGEPLTLQQSRYDHQCDRCSYLASKC